MSDQSSNLQLPYLAQGQAQKHVTVNESLLRLDAIVQLSAVSATTTAEPGAPNDGQIYLLPAGKTGAHWAAMSSDALAYYRDGAWEEIAPREGWIAYIKDTDTVLAYSGSGWASLRSTLGAAADTAVVHNTGAETIAGAKTFTSTIIGRTAFANVSLASSSAPDARGFRFSLSGATSNTIYFQSTLDNYASTSVVATIDASNGVMTFVAGAPTVSGEVVYHAGANVIPGADNAYNLGSSSARFGTVYATTGSINTSDEREKTEFSPVPESVKRAVRRVVRDIGVFQWKDAIAEKGEAARLHVGVSAQRVRDAFNAEGENAERWALFCRDKTGDGERLGLRYDQLFALALASIP